MRRPHGTVLGMYPHSLHKEDSHICPGVNQPGRMALLVQAPGQLGNTVSRLKPTQESGPLRGWRQSSLASVEVGCSTGTLGGTEVAL